MQVRLKLSRKSIDDALKFCARIGGGICARCIVFELAEASTESMMLFDVAIEKALLSSHLLESYEHSRFLELVVVNDPCCPYFGQKEQVCDIFGLTNVGRPKIDAVDTT